MWKFTNKTENLCVNNKLLQVALSDKSLSVHFVSLEGIKERKKDFTVNWNPRDY